jgi:hypothetical protein
MEATTFVGLDVHKRMTSVAIAESGRGGEVRFLGEIPSTPEALHRLVERLQGRHRQLRFCYEAGPCGYGVHRLLSGLDQDCRVVAPSLIPSRPGDRVKTKSPRCDHAGQTAPGRQADAGMGARCRPRGHARSGAGARQGAARARQEAVQRELLIGWHEMPSAPGHVFYDRLNGILDEAAFDREIETLCVAHYAAGVGRPGVPPGRCSGCCSSATSRAWTASAASPGAAPTASRCGSS